MNKSESIKELAAAFVKAQKLVEGAKKDSLNPGLKNKYADLGSVWEACRVALQVNNLGVAQFPIDAEGGIGVETILIHSSGEWISGHYVLPFPTSNKAGNDTQAGGSGITYARRYALAALMGVCPEDDDGNAASAASKNLRDKALSILREAVEGGSAAYAQAWATISKDMRLAVGTQTHEAMKRQSLEADESLRKERKEERRAPAAV